MGTLGALGALRGRSGGQRSFPWRFWGRRAAWGVPPCSTWTRHSFSAPRKHCLLRSTPPPQEALLTKNHSFFSPPPPKKHCLPRSTLSPPPRPKKHCLLRSTLSPPPPKKHCFSLPNTPRSSAYEEPVLTKRHSFSPPQEALLIKRHCLLRSTAY